MVPVTDAQLWAQVVLIIPKKKLKLIAVSPRPTGSGRVITQGNTQSQHHHTLIRTSLLNYSIADSGKD